MGNSDSQAAANGATSDPRLQIILDKLELIQSDINAMDNDIAEFKLALFKRVWIVAGVAVIVSVLLMRLLI